MDNAQKTTQAVELTEQESWKLFLDMAVARLGVVVDGHPEVFPVNYIVMDDEIFIRTGPGTKLSGAVGSPVCLEVDDYDPTLSGHAWSVMIKGTASEVDADDARQQAVPLFQWHAGAEARLVRIEPRQISGRRYGPALVHH